MMHPTDYRRRFDVVLDPRELRAQASESDRSGIEATADFSVDDRGDVHDLTITVRACDVLDPYALATLQDQVACRHGLDAPLVAELQAIAQHPCDSTIGGTAP